MSDKDSLDTNRTDIVVMGAKSIAGFIPYAGPIIGEIIGTLIPEQRQDRIVYFIRKLDERVTHLEQTALREKMTTPEFIDLFENGAMQSARALSDERRDQIAALLANSLTEEELDHVGTKLLLNLLGELNEAELILLKYYSIDANPYEQEKFAELHPKMFEVHPLVMSSSQDEGDQNAINESFKSHLVRLGLLGRKFPKIKKGELPEFDERTGTIKAKGYRITSLGRLLVRVIE